ncbi:MAG: thioredoxin domain-containing protein, partial [Acidobacteriaceae bacterium]|nr:thioredoxin domain-containing protein [Acidobacteriaceae bacterium]
VNWNSLCVSAYLQASRVLGLEDARHFALRSLDRILAEAWHGDGASTGMLRHVIAYSDPDAQHRDLNGFLDDYAYTAIACLDAYETTADLSYFTFARRIADAMIQRFHDDTAGGFFDAEAGAPGTELGALATRRKPFQDSPTPAANPCAAIALLRLHAYTNESRYRDCTEDTLELFAGMAPQYGMFAGTYGIAATLFASSHTQVVVVGTDDTADRLGDEALAPFALNKSVLRLREVAAPNLPPALAETLPNLPGVAEERSMAVLCSNFACRAPVFAADELRQALKEVLG